MPIARALLAIYAALGMLILGTAESAVASQNPFALQKFEIADLRVWSIVRDGKRAFAYVADREGYLYHVESGEYLGTNFGIVKKVDECGLAIVELIQDSQGDWQERKNFLRSSEFDKKRNCAKAEKGWLPKITN